MANLKNINIINRNTPIWRALVSYCNKQHGSIEDFKDYYGGGSGYDVGYDKYTGEVVLINKRHDQLLATDLMKGDLGF